VIRFIEDDELPVGHDWLLVRHPNAYMFFVKRSKVTREVLEAGWAEYERMAGERRMRSA
jgi:hypothetical protein